jgi:hypothetical protein
MELKSKGIENIVTVGIPANTGRNQRQFLLRNRPADRCPANIHQKMESNERMEILSPWHQQAKNKNGANRRPPGRGLPNVVKAE